MSASVKTYGIIVALFAGILSLFILAWSLAFATRPAIIYSNPQKQPVEVCSGSVMQVERTLEFTRHLELTISRALTRDAGENGIETIGLTSFSVFRQKKVIDQSRSVYIPTGIPLGEWTMKTYVTSHEFPFWEISHEAPDIKIDIVGRCE